MTTLEEKKIVSSFPKSMAQNTQWSYKLKLKRLSYQKIKIKEGSFFFNIQQTLSSLWKVSAPRGTQPLMASAATAESQEGHPAATCSPCRWLGRFLPGQIASACRRRDPRTMFLPPRAASDASTEEELRPKTQPMIRPLPPAGTHKTTLGSVAPRSGGRSSSCCLRECVGVGVWIKAVAAFQGWGGLRLLCLPSALASTVWPFVQKIVLRRKVIPTKC